MNKKIKIITAILLFFGVLCSCNSEKIELPDLQIAINYQRYTGPYDDQLYELKQDGTLKVILCRLQYNNYDDLNKNFEFFEFYNEEGKREPCRFDEKTVRLSYKQKKIIYDLLEKLMKEEEIKNNVSYLDQNRMDLATVFIKIGEETKYLSTYTKDYATSKETGYSPEILDLTYRFMDFAPIEPRKEWVTGSNSEDKFIGSTSTISGITTHTHKWK